MLALKSREKSLLPEENLGTSLPGLGRSENKQNDRPSGSDIRLFVFQLYKLSFYISFYPSQFQKFNVTARSVKCSLAV